MDKIQNIKKAFIKGGMEDEILIDFYPDTNDRLAYLTKVFNNFTIDARDPYGMKMKIIDLIIPDRPEKGDRGESGRDGYTPVKGRDYFTSEDLKELKDNILKDIVIPAPQVTEKTIVQKIAAEVPTDTIVGLIEQAFAQFDISAEEIKRKIESLKGDLRIDASAIKNLPRSGGGQYIGVGGSNFTIGSGLTLADNIVTNDLITGKVGGQTIYGGTGASENLVLISTTNATKGLIQIGATNQIVVTTTGAGFGTTAPTHTITLPSTATGIAYYNTSDQTTNYERIRQFWSGNVFTVQTEVGGTGAARSMKWVAGASSTVQMTLDVNGSTGGLLNMARSTSGSSYAWFGTSGTNSASSGIVTGFSSVFTVNQSGTAGYTGFFANITETATGSGAKLLMDLQIGSSSKFKIDNAGVITLAEASNLVLGTTTGTKFGTGTTQKLSFWNKTPIVQPTTGITGATNVGGVGTTVKVDDTFGGYTIAQIAAALVNVGILA